MSGLAQLAKMGVKGADALVDALRSAKKFVAPQDEALALAQQRAALPVEQGGLGLGPANTAAERAKAMGFADELYHGTGADIQKFDKSFDKLDRGFWFGSPDVASGFAASKQATGGSPNVIPSMVRVENPYVYDALDPNKAKGLKEIFQNASDDIYDGVRMVNTNSPAIVVKNPDQVRSRFAAFDPWRKTAATAAAFGVAAPNLLAEELRKK
jgi:hypothetical protein